MGNKLPGIWNNYQITLCPYLANFLRPRIILPMLFSVYGAMLVYKGVVASYTV